MRDPNPEHFVNRCSCPDYKSTNLGTCKHVEAVLDYIRRKLAPQIKAPNPPPRNQPPDGLRHPALRRRRGWTAAPVYDHSLDPGLLRLVNHYLVPYLHLLEDTRPIPHSARALRARSRRFRWHAVVEPEVYDYAETAKAVRSVKSVGEAHLHCRSGQARLDLLNLPLYPYQAVGTLFLAFTERALLADDMGLGKTIEALAAALCARVARHPQDPSRGPRLG